MRPDVKSPLTTFLKLAILASASSRFFSQTALISHLAGVAKSHDFRYTILPTAPALPALAVRNFLAYYRWRARLPFASRPYFA